MELMYQCKLQRADERVVSWIPKRGAKLGACVELLAYGPEKWVVIEVFTPPIEEKVLKEHQKLSRDSLLSIVVKR